MPRMLEELKVNKTLKWEKNKGNCKPQEKQKSKQERHKLLMKRPEIIRQPQQEIILSQSGFYHCEEMP